MKTRTRAETRLLVLLLGALVLFPAARVEAADVYVVRFGTDIVYSSPTECYRVGWRDHLLFRNTTSQDLIVRALSAGNGHTLPNPDLLTVPARRNRSLLILRRAGENGGSNNWAPGAFMVNRLDVPAGVLVESRGELYGPETTALPCQAPPGSLPSPEVFGTIPLPVVRTLTPAGVEHVHLATDLGTQRIRVNVGIYNAGAAAATALVEVRRSCDDVLIEARAVMIPTNSVTQALGFNDSPRPTGCTSPATTEFSRYVTVAMDQPGFSFVTTLANDLPPRIAVTASVAR